MIESLHYICEMGMGPRRGELERGSGNARMLGGGGFSANLSAALQLGEGEPGDFVGHTSSPWAL